MKEKYIVLRGPPAGKRLPEGVRGGDLRNVGPSLDIEEIDPRKVPALARHNDVQALARDMPMKLIAPVAFKDTAKRVPSDVAWGLKAVGADTSPFRGDGINVAVLDSGIDATHPAFSGVDLIQEDFTGEGNGDENGHGTHCAGTIFGRTVQGVRIGVAPGVTKALIGKILGENGASSVEVAKAIMWAVSKGANVISMSIGIDFPGYVAALERKGTPTELATTYALEGYLANVRLFERLAELVRDPMLYQAVVIVAAAGNESKLNDDPPFAIAVSPPAVANGIVSVAALGQGTEGLTFAPFSNIGARVSGPGVDIVSAEMGGGLSTKSGTSMATPHVAGVAALWAQQIQSTTARLRPLELEARLVASAGHAGLQAGFDPDAVGGGLVRAPQN